MSSSNSFSIFDPGSHKQKKPPPKSAPPPPKKVPETEESRKKKRELAFQDPQIKEWIERIEVIHKEISDKVSVLLEKGGHTSNSISKYLGDRKNFTAKQWDLIQKGQEDLEKNLGLALDPSFRRLKAEKQTESTSKERKGKTLGGRKNWMNMR